MNSWIDSALFHLRVFCRRHRGRIFAFEEFRQWAVSGNRLDEPRHHNSWGALASAASKERVVRPTGKFRRAVSSRTHGHPVRLWRAA
ncbi:MAG: hypothetical protein LBI35_02690 [Burkholderiales bacterium]|jgi:hypothetical protein|nr:hypothetical protein [Burkholderiales bacterium]